MEGIRMVPGGYESDDSDNSSYYNYGSSNNQTTLSISPSELQNETFFGFVKNNEVDQIRNELKNRPQEAFDIDSPIKDGWSMLFHACYLAQPDVVQFLIQECGASINITNGCETPLMVACYSDGDSESVLKVVKELVKESTIVSSSNLLGMTPLMFASRHGHANVVSYLLAINDSFDAIDNEGKNALFHAIDGKSVEVAKLLIAAGIDLLVTNKYGYTAKDYARDELQHDIHKLFPAEIERYQAPCNYMSYNRLEDLIPGISDIPDYFPDIAAMLRGTNCARFIDKFAEAKINLFEFLTIDDKKLQEIGIEFKFERNLILAGLYKFHKEPWTQKSLLVPDKFKEELSDLDLMLVLANVLRQLVVVKSQLVYIENLGKEDNLKAAFNHMTTEFLEDFRKNVKVLQKLMAKKKVSRPLMIKSKAKNRRNIVKYFVIGIAPIFIYTAFKLIKK